MTARNNNETFTTLVIFIVCKRAESRLYSQYMRRQIPSFLLVSTVLNLTFTIVPYHSINYYFLY